MRCNGYRDLTYAGHPALMCGGGSATADKVVGRARVRFEPDPRATDPTKRAVVPKILSWQTTLGV